MIKVKVTFESGRTIDIGLEGGNFNDAVAKFLKASWQIYSDGAINVSKIEKIEPTEVNK